MTGNERPHRAERTRPAAAPGASFEEIPGPRGRQLVDALFHLWRRPHEFLLELAMRYGPMVSLPFPLERLVLVSDPQALQYLLHNNPQNYLRRTARWRIFRELVGDGLLTLDGDEWRRQRQRIQPAFHHERLIAFEHLLEAEVGGMLERWRTLAAADTPIDIGREMLRLSLVTITKTLFGGDIEQVADAALRAFAAVHVFINPTALANLLDLPRFIRRMIAPGFREYERAMETLDRIIQRIVAERRASLVDTGDVLSMLILARDDELGQTMTDIQIRDEVMTLIQAGHEPMAVGVTWACYLLARYPPVREQLRAEARQVLAGRFPTMDDLPRLKLHRMVVEETVRLYPPAWGVDRVSAAADQVGGYEIPAGTTVLISSYVMHRHPAYWTNPEGFDPLRFTEENSVGRPTYAYLPFGGGARRCIGFRFALAHMQMVLAAVVQSFDLDLMPGPPVAPRPIVNLVPRRSILMRLQPVRQDTVAA